MQWLEVSARVQREAIEAVAETMMRHGAAGVEIDDPRLMMERQTSVGDWDYAELPPNYDPDAEPTVRCWLQIGPSTPDEVALIEQEIKLLPGFGLNLGSGVVSTQVVAEQNWAEVWKAYFKPLRVGKKLVVKPAWERWAGTEDIVIEMDPGLAFGTGNHATTRMCMVLLEEYLRPGQDVIDVGCGSGILSVTAAKLAAGSVEAIDIDPLAVESTLSNLTLNALEGQVAVKQGDLLQVSERTADIVLANIIADVIIRMLPDIPRVLKADGLLICSGIIDDRKNDVETALLQAGFRLEQVLEEEDWVAMAARWPGGTRK